MSVPLTPLVIRGLNFHVIQLWVGAIGEVKPRNLLAPSRPTTMDEDPSYLLNLFNFFLEVAQTTSSCGTIVGDLYRGGLD